MGVAPLGLRLRPAHARRCEEARPRDADGACVGERLVGDGGRARLALPYIAVGTVNHGTRSGATMTAAPSTASATAVVPIAIGTDGKSFSRAMRAAITSI